MLRNKEKEITNKMTTPIHFLVFIAGPETGFPGWENATGVKGELAAAVRHGVPVFDLADPQLQQKLEKLRKSLP